MLGFFISVVFLLETAVLFLLLLLGFTLGGLNLPPPCPLVFLCCILFAAPLAPFTTLSPIFLSVLFTPGTLEAIPPILPIGRNGRTLLKSFTIDLGLRTFFPSLFTVKDLFSLIILPSLTVFFCIFCHN